MKKHRKQIIGWCLLAMVLLVIAASPTFQSFVPSQFAVSVPNNTVSIASNAFVTNLTSVGNSTNGYQTNSGAADITGALNVYSDSFIRGGLTITHRLQGYPNNDPALTLRQATNAPTNALIVLKDPTGTTVWGGFDSNGVPFGNAATVLYRSGSQAIGNLSTSQAVVFTTPLPPSVGANYSVWITYDSTLGASVSSAATSKTTNGFTITLSAGIAGGVTADYGAFPYQ